MRRRGLEVDKATLSGTLKGTITGPRVSKIMEVAHDIQSGYETFISTISA